MHNPLAPLLATRPYLLLDGGLATELEARGCDLDDPLWSALLLHQAPERIAEVHRAYVDAGAEVLITASYQAHFAGFKRHGIGAREAARLLRQSVALARQAGEDSAQPPLVAASVGPYGASLHDGSEYRGHYRMSLRELKAFHRPRLEVLLEAEPDLLAVETIPSRREAEMLLDLLDEFDAPAWISFSCTDERHISDGESLRAAIEQVASASQVIAAGINCVAPKLVTPLLEELEGIALPLVAYPNSGEQWERYQHCWSGGVDERSWNEGPARWLAAGARLIGGCCRTTPATIRALAQQLQGAAARP
jgi:homocysteine S-methyltransferase